MTPLRLEYGGGFERFCFALATYLRSKEAAVQVIAFDWSPDPTVRIDTFQIEATLQAAGVAYRKLALGPQVSGRFPTLSPGSFRRLTKLLQGCDVLYLNAAYFPGDAAVLLAAKMAGGVPAICGSHAVLLQQKALHDVVQRFEFATTWRMAARLHALNTEDGDLIARETGVSTEVIPIPIAPPEIGARPEAEGGRPIRFLFLGRLERQKGIEPLLEAVPILNSHFEPGTYTLTIAGSGTLSPAVEAAASAGLITYIPNPSDAVKAELFRTSDFLVMPSFRESFGIVTGEAMLSGLPVVGTAHTGAGDLLTDGVTGFIIKAASSNEIAEALANALLTAIREPSTVRELADRAAGAARARFDPQVIFPRYWKMFQEVARRAD